MAKKDRAPETVLTELRASWLVIATTVVDAANRLATTPRTLQRIADSLELIALAATEKTRIGARGADGIGRSSLDGLDAAIESRAAQIARRISERKAR